ncbi:MAG: DNA polymerase-1 [Chlamydiales bacterium]|jgi:DNA polymerase-1
MDKLYIVDGTGFLFRSYFAIRSMNNKQGRATNALYGFIRSIQKLRKDFNPSHLVIVFDGPNNSESRKKIYPEYKANRDSAPEDLPHQMQWAQDFCKLAGIPMLCVPKVEADDTMGSITKWAEKQESNVYICTSDKDLCQLVNDKTSVLNTHKNNLILNSTKVEEAFGVAPELIIDYLAITGDQSDNVPGLYGFGPKTAVALLKEFGSLDNILANPDKVPGKKKQETLKSDAEIALLSRRLVTLDTSVDFPKEEVFFELKDPDPTPLKEFYFECDFSSLINELDHSNGDKPPVVEEKVSYELVDDDASLKALLEILKNAKEISFDTETTHVHPLKAKLVGIGFCIQEKQAWYVPANGKLGLEAVLQAFKPLFENPSIGFYAHNAKYDMHVLDKHGIKIKNLCFDTILASYLLNSHSHRHSLDHLSMQYFGKAKTPIKSLISSGKNEIGMNEVPINDVKDYCCEDVDYTLRLKLLLKKELEERKLTHLLLDMELPLLRILKNMEKKGIYICVKLLQDMSKEFTKEIAILEDDIHELAGEPFNVNSPKQLSQILFEKLGIPPSKKKNTGHSTNAEVLEGLKRDYPIAGKVLEYRSLEKLRSTYIDSLPHDVNDKTSRIHCSFNQYVAATGRLSCQDPNLQNIPIRTKAGRRIREAFRPQREGWSFLSADYSQIELRLLAHLSGDPDLISAFKNGEDIHSFTASQVFGIPLDQVDKSMRSQAKAVNFGIIYGQQAFGLSRELNISIRDASQFIEKYFSRYSRVKNFIEDCKNKARKTGKSVTITGRERLIPDINSKNGPIRSASERLAVNTPLQGTAADLIKLAMLRVNDMLQKENKLGYMILQIHDELVFEVPDFELLDFEPLVRRAMEKVFKLKVPLTVDISIGKNWKEC